MATMEIEWREMAAACDIVLHDDCILCHQLEQAICRLVDGAEEETRRKSQLKDSAGRLRHQIQGLAAVAMELGFKDTEAAVLAAQVHLFPDLERQAKVCDQRIEVSLRLPRCLTFAGVQRDCQ